MTPDDARRSVSTTRRSWPICRWRAVADVLGGTPDRLDVPLKYKPNGVNLAPVSAMLKSKIGPPKPATVRWANGMVQTTPETTVMRLDAKRPSRMPSIEALQGDRTVDLPDPRGAQAHSGRGARRDDGHHRLEYTTNFPSGNRPRCANIKLAASKLNGVIVMPGERLSFNGTVGRRTVRAGFKLAGVYKAGKHDVGVGGGICQVSTTLYNASLFANLKHQASARTTRFPVAYVPLGRDATVDYGSLDLVVENDTEAPIGVVNTYQPGRLTFRILGKKDPSAQGQGHAGGGALLGDAGSDPRGPGSCPRCAPDRGTRFLAGHAVQHLPARLPQRQARRASGARSLLLRWRHPRRGRRPRRSAQAESPRSGRSAVRPRWRLLFGGAVPLRGRQPNFEANARSFV